MAESMACPDLSPVVLSVHGAEEDKLRRVLVNLFMTLSMHNMPDKRAAFFACASDGCPSCAVVCTTVFSDNERVQYFLSAGLMVAEIMRRRQPRAAPYVGACPALGALMRALARVPLTTLVACLPLCMDSPRKKPSEEDREATAELVQCLVQCLSVGTGAAAVAGTVEALDILRAWESSGISWAGAEDAQLIFLATGFLSVTGDVGAVFVLEYREHFFLGKAGTLMGSMVGSFFSWILGFCRRCPNCRLRTPCQDVSRCVLHTVLTHTLQGFAPSTPAVSRAAHVRIVFCSSTSGPTLEVWMVMTQAWALYRCLLTRSLWDAASYIFKGPCCWLPSTVEHFVSYTRLPSAWLVPGLVRKVKKGMPPWAQACLLWSLETALDGAGGALLAQGPAGGGGAVIGVPQLPTARLPIGPRKHGKYKVVAVRLGFAGMCPLMKECLRYSVTQGLPVLTDGVLRFLKTMVAQAEAYALDLPVPVKKGLVEAMSGACSPATVGLLWDWIAEAAVSARCVSRNGYQGLCALFALVPKTVRCAVMDVLRDDGVTLMTVAPRFVLDQEEADPGCFLQWDVSRDQYLAKHPWVAAWVSTMPGKLVAHMCDGSVDDDAASMERLSISVARLLRADLITTQALIEVLLDLRYKSFALSKLDVLVKAPEGARAVSLQHWRSLLKLVLKQKRGDIKLPEEDAKQRKCIVVIEDTQDHTLEDCAEEEMFGRRKS
jgi:hypothetical protein